MKLWIRGEKSLASLLLGTAFVAGLARRMAMRSSRSRPSSRSTSLLLRKARPRRLGGRFSDAEETRSTPRLPPAFASAVTHPAAGNLGGGGFLVAFSSETGKVTTFDFREVTQGFDQDDVSRRRNQSSQARAPRA